MRQAWRKERDGAYRYAKTRGWRVNVIEPMQRAPNVRDLLTFWKPQGCIVECSGRDSGYFDPVQFGKTPVVWLGRDPRTLPQSASYVNPAPAGHGERAVREFLSAGFTNFAFLASTSDQFWSRDREADFIRTLRLNGYSSQTFGRRQHFTSSAKRTQTLMAWLKALPKPCGLLAENDYAAVEALDLARKLRIKVPSSLAVIGIDNDPELCGNAQPQLSSILLDFESAGYRASEILDTLVANPKSGPFRETYPALGLMRRGSTPAGVGAPPRILTMLTFIRENATSGISAADVARRFHGSRRLAEIEFRKATGRTILDEILRVRFEKVELLLRNRSQKLNAIAGLCGWKTENALRTAFLKRYGVSMRKWRLSAGQKHLV